MAPTTTTSDPGITAWTPVEVAAVLDQAADHLDRVGLNKGALYDKTQAAGTVLTDCRVCAIGALNVALHGKPAAGPGDAAFDAHVIASYVEEYLRTGAGLADWSDKRGGNKEQVVEVFRATAACLRASVGVAS